MRLLRIPALPRLHTFDTWMGYRNYRFLWIGNFCGNNAQWLQLLTVGWLVRDLSAGSSSSSLLVVTVGAINTLPGLVVGPWAGVLGDRVNRRKLLMSIQSIMACCAMLFSFLVLSEHVEVWHAYAYVILSGVCRSFAMPLRQALIANTVPREALGNALATNVLTITSSRLVGPIFGGVLIATIGFFWNFVLESAFYILMVLALLPMKTPYYEGGRSTQRRSPLADLKEGIMYVWRGERALFNLIVLGLIPNVLMQPFMFLLPVYTDEILQKGAEIGGSLLALNGLGGLLAAFIIASFGFIFRKGYVVLAMAIVGSLLIILMAYVSWLIPAIILVACFGFSQSGFRTTNGTLIQELAPDSLRSRITSLRSYGQGFVVVASLGVGWVADVTSVSTAITVMGSVALLATLVCFALMSRVRRLQ